MADILTSLSLEKDMVLLQQEVRGMFSCPCFQCSLQDAMHVCVCVRAREAAFGHNDLTTDNAFYWQEDGGKRLSVGLSLGCGSRYSLPFAGASGVAVCAWRAFSNCLKPSAGSCEVRLAAKLYEQHWSRVGLELAFFGAGIP